MLTPVEAQQQEIEMVSIASLVPDDHLLRKIDRVVDFSFIRERVKHLYCADNGRPALDPLVLFKLLLVGYLFGVRSERQLMREVEVNVAYRWFLGLKLRDKVPDASTLSQNRRRRFAESTIYQEIFDAIVELAMRHKLVSGAVLYTDSTHLKANANQHRFEVERVEVKPSAYLEELERAVDEDRVAHGKRPLKEKPAVPEASPSSKEIKVSRTDRDAGYMVREGKPTGFFYLDHRTVDGRHAIVTDTHATPATVHDSLPYLSRLDRQRERFGFAIRAAGVDAGYATAAVTKGLEDRNIYGVMGYRRPTHRDGYFYKREYRYDEKLDVYLCPNGQLLPYRTTNREGYGNTTPTPNSAARARCAAAARAAPTIPKWSPGMCGRRAARPSTPIAWSGSASASTNAERRPWSAASPTPNNCTDTATHGCAVSAKSRNNACWPPPRRTSRKSPCCSLQPTAIRRRKPDLRCWPPISKHSNTASPRPLLSIYQPNSRTK